MSRRAKGPRLWLRPARHNQEGAVTHAESYFILDHGKQLGTGTAALNEAEQVFAKYISEKYRRQSLTLRDSNQVLVRDVIDLYARDIAVNHARPYETERRLSRVLDFFKTRTLADINGPLCREYASKSSTDAMARRDLEELRAAINHHLEEGLHDRIVKIVLPPRRPRRERWLDRHEAARLLWTAWRRPKCKQVAKFTLIALYTGRRASVVCSASFRREPGRPWVDLTGGMLYPPARAKETKKRNPPIPLPAKLLRHLRAWQRNGQRYVVEWGGHAVTRIDGTMKEVAIAAGLGDDVTPHVLRHTAASWQMMAGTDLFEAGQFLGMTARTLESTYAHVRPKHLSSAKDAYQRMPRNDPEKD